MGSPGCAAISCVSGVFASGSPRVAIPVSPVELRPQPGPGGKTEVPARDRSAEHGAVPAPVLSLVWPKRTRFSPERAGGPVRRSWRPR